jgi:hypothetical protein
MKTYTISGKTYDHLPDPLYLNGAAYSPMTEARFVKLGGTITDDGEPTPKEAFLATLDTYLTALEAKMVELEIPITKSGFLTAAGSMLSTELVAWAESKHVPDELIKEVREQVLTFVADASRLGLTWSDLFPVVNG